MNRPEPILRSEGAAPARFTAAEFLRMAERGAFDDMKVELDHGELIRMNPPYTAHSVSQGQVIGRLAAVLGGTPIALLGEVTIVLRQDTVRAFDAALVEGAALEQKVLKPEHVLLGVEISDTTLDQDLGKKQRDYAAAGIPHYWVVDVNARVTHVMTEPSDDGYGRREVIRFDEPLDVPGSGCTIILG
jgi:Uma2 family endonuclease